MECIVSSRLDLVPATVALLDAELESHSRLASLLDASIPEGWPPGEYDRSAVEYFRARSAENAEAVGWYGWYALLRSRDEGLRILIGAGGFHGPPTSDGLLEIGYSVLPAFEGQGYATELVRALVCHAFAAERVRRVIAHTNAENTGSIKVLERAGFHFAGYGQESGRVEYVQLNPSASPTS
jgi:[ribosomal protein S5]-alanine N-acetyltransferase